MQLTLFSTMFLAIGLACLLMAGLHVALWLGLRSNKAQLWVAACFLLFAVFQVTTAGSGEAAHGLLGNPTGWQIAGQFAIYIPAVLLVTVWSLFAKPVRGWRLGVLIADVCVITPRFLQLMVHDARVLRAGGAETWEQTFTSGGILGPVTIAASGLVTALFLAEIVMERKRQPAIARVGGIAGVVALLMIARELVRAWTGGPSLLALTGLPFAAFASAIVVREYVVAVRQGASAGGEVGKYRLIRRLASGGMGELYLAARTGPGGFTRYVALKKMLEGWDQRKPGRAPPAEWIERFLSEARLSAQLQHPNVVAVYDLGRLPEGGWYIVMEYLAGVSLADIRDHLRESGRPMPAGIALQIVEQVCRGLSYAHASGIVHRDISPHNVMVTFDGGVKIVDFGIAKAVGDAAAGAGTPGTPSSADLTEPGMVLGKQGYMSPEQAFGMTITPASDQFSLGVVLFEMLAGRRPVERTLANERAGNSDDLKTIRPDLSPEVEAIVRRAREREAPRRYASLDEMASAVRKAAAPLPHEDLGPWLRELFPEEWRTRRPAEEPSLTLAGATAPAADAVDTRAVR